MTCFSIQKSLVLGLFTAITLAVAALAGPSTAFSQTEDSIQSQTEEMGKFARKMENKNQGNLIPTNAPIVIELFTTIDCSACVFADRVLFDALKNKNVIALSCRVDDVSDISSETGEVMKETSDGPMDPCTFRLWTYQPQRNERDIGMSVPNVIFNGNARLGIADLANFNSTLAMYGYEDWNKSLEVFMKWEDEDTITIHLPQALDYERENRNASVWLMRYKDIDVVKVDKGINKGRVLRFSNVIETSRHIAKWRGVTRVVKVDVPRPQGGKLRGGYAVLVQETMGDPIIAAGKLADYPLPQDRKKIPIRTVEPSTQKIAPAAPPKP